MEQRYVLAQQLYFSKVSCCINWQKSHIWWLKEGDTNSKSFHIIMANRRRHNIIRSIDEEGVHVLRVEGIRESVFYHFCHSFLICSS